MMANPSSLTATPPPGTGMSPVSGPSAPAPSYSVTPTPISTAPVSAAGKAFSNAILVGAAGTKKVGALGQWFLSVADRFDELLYGSRAAVVSIAAALTVTVTGIETYTNAEAPLFTAIATFLFILLLFLLAVARLGSLRDDDGNWSLSLVSGRVSETADDLNDAISPSSELTAPVRWKAAGKMIMSVALVVLALRNVVTLFLITIDEFFSAHIDVAESIGHWMFVAGAGLLGLGALSWIIGWQRLRSAPDAQWLRPNAEERRRIITAVSGLPPIIDCTGEAGHVRELARRAGHPVLMQLLEHLSTWQPRPSTYEKDYQAALFRMLRRKMPGANPQRERPIGDRSLGTRGRADLVVSDSVLIEMKRGLSTTAADRAIGQIRRYTEAWKNGPVMLLLCDADPVSAQRFLEQQIIALHREAPVLMVFAGRRK